MSLYVARVTASGPSNEVTQSITLNRADPARLSLRVASLRRGRRPATVSKSLSRSRLLRSRDTSRHRFPSTQAVLRASPCASTCASPCHGLRRWMRRDISLLRAGRPANFACLGERPFEDPTIDQSKRTRSLESIRCQKSWQAWPSRPPKTSMLIP